MPKSKPMFRGAVVRPPAGATASARASAPPAGARTSPSGAAKVRVGREVAGRGGKAVSVISGLPLAPAELDALATRLKKLCGAGGAVKDGAIEIQGDHRERLVSELRALGYDAKRSGG